MISVDEIMSSTVYTLTPENCVLEARLLMNEKRIRHIPIIENGRLVGLVSQRDVLAASDSSLHELSERSRLQLEQEHKLREIMSTEVATIDYRDSLKSAALRMRKYRYGCLPVLQSGKLVGIVTDTDFVGIAVHLIEQLEEADSEAWGDDFEPDSDSLPGTEANIDSVV
ncbi:MAG: CBS domain-containing protein [Pseudomonadales bacterium]|nr:CBS domain-containing protein [Pseudomonadales bacterium]